MSGWALFLACRSAPIPELSNGVFVWQRVWTPGLLEAAQQIASTNQLYILAGEIEWTPQARLFLSEAPYEKLPPHPILAIRVGVFPNQDNAHEEQEATRKVRQVLDFTAQQGVIPAEIHIDHDCPTARLPQCTHWLKSLDIPAPLSITILPDWLDSPDFPALLQHTAYYVLQAHMLTPGSPPTIYQPDRTEAWVKAASKLGHPFKLALPTYQYQIKGQTITADPTQLAEQIKHWQNQPPPNLSGLLFFRLPHPQDLQTWPLPTLLALQQGRPPHTAQRTTLQTNDHVLYNILVENIGETRIIPEKQKICWSEKATGDAVNHGLWQSTPAHGWLTPTLPLEPGQSVIIGWVRTEGSLVLC